MSLYSETLTVIHRHGLLRGVRSVLVGLSGGPDSVCLLGLLVQMKERGDLSADLHAAHLNHGLRAAESDEDERFARAFAEQCGVPVTVERRDVNAARAREGCSLEDAARRERYSFLSSAARRVGAGAVAVGHTADDQIETVLHRLIRGTGPRGMRGMALTRPIRKNSDIRLIRPLLRARRRDILEYLKERGLSFREDSSNADQTFLRNRIRRELLPLLGSYNPLFGESVLRLARSMGDVADLLQDAARDAVRDCVTEREILLEPFGRVPGAVRPLVIDAAVAGAAARVPQLDAAHYEAVIELALAGEPGARISLPGGIEAVRTSGAVRFGTADPPPEPEAAEVPVAVPGRVTAGRVLLSTSLAQRSEFDLDAFLMTKTRYDEVMDFDSLAGRLLLRPRRNGDVFRPLGAAGRKKVGDFLTDLKTPAGERRRLMIVADEQGPVWVIGCRIDERVKVTAGTKQVLRLSAQVKDG